LLQLKQVFRQHCFPLSKRRHIFFLLMNPERGPCLWTHALLSTNRYKAPPAERGRPTPAGRTRLVPEPLRKCGYCASGIPFFNPGNPFEEDEIRDLSTDIYGELLQLSFHDGIQAPL
jgi:hypothetical protein